jgi:hypothetical protein
MRWSCLLQITLHPRPCWELMYKIPSRSRSGKLCHVRHPQFTLCKPLPRLLLRGSSAVESYACEHCSTFVIRQFDTSVGRLSELESDIRRFSNWVSESNNWVLIDNCSSQKRENQLQSINLSSQENLRTGQIMIYRIVSSLPVILWNPPVLWGFLKNPKPGFF